MKIIGEVFFLLLFAELSVFTVASILFPSFVLQDFVTSAPCLMYNHISFLGFFPRSCRYTSTVSGPLYFHIDSTSVRRSIPASTLTDSDFEVPFQGSQRGVWSYPTLSPLMYSEIIIPHIA